MAMKTRNRTNRWSVMVFGIVLLVCAAVARVSIAEDFPALVTRLQGEKPKFAARHRALLAARYDLADRPAQGVTMSRGKPVQGGVRVKLPKDTTWEQLAAMSPEEIKEKNLWPAGFYPVAASASRGGRHGVPAGAHRRDQAPDRT